MEAVRKLPRPEVDQRIGAVIQRNRSRIQPAASCRSRKVGEERLSQGPKPTLQEPAAAFLFVDGIVQADEDGNKLAADHGEATFGVPVPGPNARRLQLDVRCFDLRQGQLRSGSGLTRTRCYPNDRCAGWFRVSRPRKR